MTSNHTTTPAAALRRAAAEQRFAAAEIAAPIVTAGLMLAVDPATASTLATFTAAPVLVAVANAAGFIGSEVLDKVPGGNVLRGHRIPFLVSTLATFTAAATGAVQGTPGIDSLVAGWMEMPTLTGAVSAAWLAASGYAAFSLRRVIGRRRATPAEQNTGQGDPDGQPAHADILQPWVDHISWDRGTNPGQHLNLTARGPEAWTGQIQSSAPGQPVTVTRETVSGVYQLPVDWIHIVDGPHASSKVITVRTAPPTTDEAQQHALQALWAKRIARSGGAMPGTHLEGVIPDSATGGVAAWIVADEDTDAITTPDQTRIAGALRTTPLLVSVEPTSDPRKAILRLMDRSPLEDGKPLPGPDALLANANGFVQIGTGISGRPARVQLFDPKGGARHCLVCGVTGSGKGGVLQLICLSYHTNGIAIIYADPKGSSNPDVEDMAAYAGCGRDGAMGALRVAYAILQHRIAESQQLRAKNFTATPDRPYVAVVLDEFAQLLGEKSPYLAEAAMIVAAIAEQGRSLGMAMVLCGQILNLDKMGSDTSIRDNIFYGGALVLLRSDSAQKNRVDLPDAFDGVDPSKIPAYWRTGEESLVYDPTVPEDDPSRTFGVGYVVGPDERAEMMRAWILESAAGMFDPDNIAIPLDFPDWADRDRIAEASTLDGGDEDDLDAWAPAPASPSMRKEPTAKEKILTVLDERRDPLGLDVIYLHINDIVTMTGVAKKTIENKLTELVADNRVVRNTEVPGEYGYPTAPSTF